MHRNGIARAAIRLERVNHHACQPGACAFSSTHVAPPTLARSRWVQRFGGLTLCVMAQASSWAMVPSDNAPTALKKLSIEELMTIEVSSVSRRPEKLAETASAVQVITADDIRRAGASSLPEALRLASNLQVAQKNAHDWGISARGFNTELANKLLVLIDGRTVYTPLFSGVFWDVQDYLLEDIDRVEVISGPGGTLWGANAVNGVINITTKHARNTQGLYTEAGGGTELRDFAAIRYGGQLNPNLSFRLYAKHFDRDGSALASGADVSDAWHMSQGGFRIDAEGLAQHALTFQGDIYDGRQNLATGSASEVHGGNLLGRWLYTVSEDSDMRLQIYYDRTHLALPKPTNNFAPAGVFTDDLSTYDLDFQHQFRPGLRHQIVWGVGYRFTHDVVSNAPTLVLLPTRLDHTLYSAFVQDKLTLQENLFLTLGTKLEHNDYTGFEHEPSARLQWNVVDGHMIWAAVSRAVRTPSRVDRDMRQPTGLPAPFPQSILDGNPNFTSENLLAYELGHRAQLSAVLTTSVSVFYNDYDELRSTTPGRPGFPTFGFPLVFENNLEGETYGLEFAATYQALDWWRLRGGYNWLKENLRVDAGYIDFSNALNETADPEHQASLRSSMDLPADLQLDVGLRWTDTLHNNNGPNAGTVPSYFEADIRLGWRLSNGLELALIGQNLLHDHHAEYGYPSTARAEIERSVTGKATWQF